MATVRQCQRSHRDIEVFPCAGGVYRRWNGCGRDCLGDHCRDDQDLAMAAGLFTAALSARIGCNPGPVCGPEPGCLVFWTNVALGLHQRPRRIALGSMAR